MIDVSVVIVNYKSWDALRECLEALTTIHSNRFSFETIVVDNHSNDGKLEAFETLFPSINFIKNSGNNGFANGCNTGANLAKGDYLLFLNPDTVAGENAIYELWNSAKKNPDFGIVTCTQLNEKGKTYKEVRFFPSLKTLFGSFRAINKLFTRSKIIRDFNPDKTIIFPDWATGAVIFMSVTWYEKIKGWNEKYWLYFEDVDICKRVANQGGKVALLRQTSILHKHGGASRINIKTKALTKTEVLISQHVYFNEHSRGFERLLIQFLIVSSLLFEKTVMAILGIIFFFVPKLKVNFYIFKNLLTYYISAIYNRTWTSSRSMLYKQH
ncbi:MULTISPECIES: glycosyltransferase family 2 protein [unclassified Flavobacterium]|jgi:GT2 family glycosyltransferase|uniref:glycosyltransferase family 2 protein n=1 Tax=unclassified Flavobacterium TaxID=196869 RepID=UPI0025B8584A|nr:MULTISPECIES: glycosyltransferase family 2 protein [unclassified Flavobacterium]